MDFQVPSWHIQCLPQVRKTDEGLAGYLDSDFAADLDKRRSLTGYVFTLGGCVVSWRATLQSVVAQSTTEAEYMAIAFLDKGVRIPGLCIKVMYTAIRNY